MAELVYAEVGHPLRVSPYRWMESTPSAGLKYPVGQSLAGSTPVVCILFCVCDGTGIHASLRTMWVKAHPSSSLGIRTKQQRRKIMQEDEVNDDVTYSLMADMSYLDTQPVKQEVLVDLSN